MDRRSFIRGAGVAGAGAVASSLAAPAVAQGNILAKQAQFQA